MLETIDQSIIKNLNRARILRAFRVTEQIQKRELVDLLGLSITTVTANTRALLDEGFIEEMGIAESTGGRKPIVYRFVKNVKVSVGVDISPNRCSVILANLASENLATRHFDIQNSDMDGILETLQLCVKELLADHGYDMSDCLGVGISLPGIVDDTSKVLVSAPNLDVSYYDFKPFETKLGLPVFIENEANVSAFAELVVGAAVKLDNAVFVSISEGVGCGIIANHSVNKGTFNKAGEFGHMRISERPLKCGCGRTGCWELFSSERALVRTYIELCESESKAFIDPEVIFKGYHSGDATATRAIERYIQDLFVGIDNIILGLDPEVVIIGGRMAKYLRSAPELINPYIERSEGHGLPRGSKVLLSALEPHSALVGSSLLPIKDIFGY